MAKPSAGAPKLETASVSDLRRELLRRQRRGEALLRRRDRIAARLRALDALIADLGISFTHGNGVISTGHTRFRNPSSLADALAASLRGKTLSIAEAMHAVQSAGYRTTARNFRVMVTLALTKDKRFKRIKRGHYTTR